MGIQELLNNPFAFNFVLGLGRFLPPWLAAPILKGVSAVSMTRRFHSERIQAMIANQWVIHDGQIDPAKLEDLVEQTLYNRMRAQFDLYHNLSRPERLHDMVYFGPRLKRYLDTPTHEQRGAMLVGPHMGNFDLLGWALAQRYLYIQVITIANPPKSYQRENKARRRAGLDITPASMQALHTASQRLRSGGVVVTAIDRPFPGSSYAPRFFGRPAKLPVLHVRLALKADVPVVVMAAVRQSDGTYLLDASPPIPMQPHPDHDTEILQNAEAVLKVAETFIQKAPEQWCMFYPVWPEALQQCPLFPPALRNEMPDPDILNKEG